MPASEIMPKFRAGTLHSGSPSGPIVRNPAQARAIQISYARKEGADIPMMTTNSGAAPPAGPYQGRVRGLRQGGRKMAKSVSAGASKPPLGSGQRFKNLVGQLSHKPGVTNAKGLAAFIGQRKYGAKKMSQMAAANRGKRGGK